MVSYRLRQGMKGLFSGLRLVLHRFQSRTQPSQGIALRDIMYADLVPYFQ